jgi:scyllo-inositol 2-dehydrogenase (NADP+)
MNHLRLGIVGPGLIWENAHRPVLDRMAGRVSLVAFSATREASRQKVARDYPGAAFFTDYHELVRQPDVDVVVVLTPIPLNAPVALAALQAGKHVMVEKPMARTLNEARALVAAARERNLQLLVLEQFGYRPSVGMLRELLRSGAIGDLIMYDRVSHSMYDAARHSTRGYGTTAWRIHPDFPLGTLFDGGHHSIAQLSRLFGRPQAVTASGVQLRPEYGQYDQVLMLFEYASGLRGVFSHSDSLGGGRNYFHVRGKQGVATVERQRVVVTNNEGNEVRTVDLDDADTYGAMWRELVDCVQQGRSPSYIMEDALDDLATLLAVARSVEEGTRVEVAP